MNSVYGSDQLLLFRRASPSPSGESLLLPTLLTFDQGAALDAELSGSESGVFASIGLAGKLLARQEFFEAVAGQKFSPWKLAQMAGAPSGLADAMLSHLTRHDLRPTSCTLGTAAEEGDTNTVGMRDMGANTPSAPSSVRLTAQLPATLLCDMASGQHIVVPLGGAADAVILAQHLARAGGELPLVVSQSLWDMRAVSPGRLPAIISSQNCTLDGCALA